MEGISNIGVAETKRISKLFECCLLFEYIGKIPFDNGKFTGELQQVRLERFVNGFQQRLFRLP